MIRKNFFVNKGYSKLAKLGLVLAIIGPLAACSGSDDDDLVGNWVQVSDFSGVPRTSAVSATIDDLGYVGTGYNYDQDERLQDFWTFNPTNGTWYQIASFPGAGRTNAVAFAAAGKLYVGTGFDGTNGVRLKDFYEYTPGTNTWVQISDLTTDNANSPELIGREGMIAFSVGDIGYVATGVDKDGILYKDMYAYNPEDGSWTQKSDFPGTKRKDAVVFVIDDIAYVCTGISNGSYPDDFYSYDASLDTWTKLRAISDKSDDSYDDDYELVRNSAVGFAVGGKGYVATGGKSTSSNDVWEYNPSTDLWTQKTDFEGSARLSAVAFTIDDKGYVLTGQQGSTSNFDDIWRFDPNAEYDDED